MATPVDALRGSILSTRRISLVFGHQKSVRERRGGGKPRDGCCQEPVLEERLAIGSNVVERSAGSQLKQVVVSKQLMSVRVIRADPE